MTTNQETPTITAQEDQYALTIGLRQGFAYTISPLSEEEAREIQKEVAEAMDNQVKVVPLEDVKTGATITVRSEEITVVLVNKHNPSAPAPALVDPPG